MQDVARGAAVSGGVGVKRKTVDYGHSARARLLALANREHLQLEYVLLRYALERFLYRLGKSRWAEKFVLKGASVFAVWSGPFCRVTRDADLETFGDVGEAAMAAAFKEICAVEFAEDGVVFDVDSIESSAIKKEDKYPGTRIFLNAFVGGARVRMQFDIGVGDSIYPDAEVMEYPALLEMERPRIRIYPRYTIVAEKFQVMVSRGILNSRLKDYYDVWMLSGKFEFDMALLRRAVELTFSRRDTDLPLVLPESISPEFSRRHDKRVQWKAFLKRTGIEELDFGMVVAEASDFLRGLCGDVDENAVWNTKERKWCRRGEMEIG